MKPEPSIASQRREQGLALERRLDLLTGPAASGIDPLLGARTLWKRLPLPQSLRRRATAWLYSWSASARARVAAAEAVGDLADLRPKPAAAIAPGPLVVSGYLSEPTGIGRAGRMSMQVLTAAGLAPRPHDLKVEPAGFAPPMRGGVWLAHCNAPEAAEFLLRSASAHAAYRVGYWAWELPELPRAWGRIAELFHEIWAPSAFTAEAIRKATAGLGVAVRVVPHPHPDISGIEPDRGRFGIAQEVFAFLCMYDVRSSATRKNPAGAIRAFQAAFAPGSAAVLLIVKVVSAAESRGCLAELRALATGWPNIRILTDTLTDREANALIASADAFVSLHRAEGFGLSIALAMALGRPVIATDWSGNLQFSGDGVLLVGAALTPVRDAAGIYFETDQVWADPDLQAAARHMRRLARSRDAARRLGEKARRTVRARLADGYDVDHLRPWLAP